VGGALLPLLHSHPQCRLTAVGSRSNAGQDVAAVVAGMQGCKLKFASITSQNLCEFPADVYFLALPNGLAAEYVAAIEQHNSEAVIIDISADYRFDPAWVYGQPERLNKRLRGAKRIANPGCYATGAQLALDASIAETAETPVIFGVSGYSGAGITPSRKNDLEVLKDNLLPYSLVDHVHEREVAAQLGKPVHFHPHVASWFRGISLTISAVMEKPMSAAALEQHYRDWYAGCSLITIKSDIPELPDARERYCLVMGGFTVSETDPRHISLVCVLDNLLKGAASQALQNLNLAFELEDELMGLHDE
jgi:N-acetyl-gamma-glutamyl-phosphate reductase